MRLPACALLISVTLTTGTAAQQRCIVCSGPSATYLCSVEMADKVARFGAFGDKAIDLACTKQLAREGGHEACSARRELVGAACNGSPRLVTIDALIESSAAKLENPKPSPAPAAAVAPAASDQKAPAGPPQTVEELAIQTGAKSKQQLKALGDSVGGAASKTWECLSTLFKKCD